VELPECPPYSLDLAPAPSDFRLLDLLNNHVGGKCFTDDEEVEMEVWKCLSQQLKLLCCGSRLIGRAVGQVYQCQWRICGQTDKFMNFATMCLPWQQWTETSIWFDDIGISVFHSCIVDLWQSLSEWHLLLSEFVLVCSHENVGTSMKFLVKLLKSGSEIGEMSVQVYRDNAMTKVAVYKWVTHFSKGRESVSDKEKLGWPAMSRTEENIAKVSSNCA
jgi:hypothetical protein